MKYYLIVFSLLITLVSCSETKETAKDALNTGGELVGKTVSEFGKGVSTGVEETFEVKILPPKEIEIRGLSIGKITLTGINGGSDNLLNVYLAFNKKFNDTLVLKAFDSRNLEMGRSFLVVKEEANHAAFYAFPFDTLTNIDADSRITLEFSK